MLRTLEAFGDDGGNAELLTSYILLAEAHLGLGNIHEAEEYLSKANIAATRNEDECTNVIKERLHRNLGKLFDEVIAVDFSPLDGPEVRDLIIELAALLHQIIF